MARRVFFSFHYDDVMGVNVVRNSDQIVRRYETAARFYDKSLWEEAKKQGSLAIKRMINRGLNGSSVTCVLIGQHTWERPWVRYEILKSLARGNGVLGVHIHDVGVNPRASDDDLVSLLRDSRSANSHGGFHGYQQMLDSLFSPGPVNPSNEHDPHLDALIAELARAPSPGPDPFRYLGYITHRQRRVVALHEVGPNGKWRPYPELPSVSLSEVPWLAGRKFTDNLGSLFPVYHWKRDDGFRLLPDWIEQAARQVGR